MHKSFINDTDVLSNSVSQLNDSHWPLDMAVLATRVSGGPIFVFVIGSQASVR